MRHEARADQLQLAEHTIHDPRGEAMDEQREQEHQERAAKKADQRLRDNGPAPPDEPTKKE